MSNYINHFKNTPFEDRLKESQKLLHKYPNRIPVIIGKLDSDNTLPFVDKNKYLVPSDITMSQLVYIVRKQMKLSSEQAMFLFINHSIYTSKTLISEVYDKYKNEDGFLYVTYAGENTFGNKYFHNFNSSIFS